MTWKASKDNAFVGRTGVGADDALVNGPVRQDWPSGTDWMARITTHAKMVPG